MRLPPYDCHVHSHLSGHSSEDMHPAEVVKAARKAGLQVFVQLEHMPQVFVGEPADTWYSRKDDRSHLNTIHTQSDTVDSGKMQVLKGAEVDPDPRRLDGSLMLDCLDGLTWTALGVHYYPGGTVFWGELTPVPPAIREQELRKYVDWLSRTFRTSGVAAWAHPGAMIAPAGLMQDFSREQLSPLEPAFAAMAENNVAFELNELLAQKLPSPFFSTYADLVRTAQLWGIRFVVGSDAHRPRRVGARNWIERLARDAFLAEHDFVSVEELRELSASAAG